MGNKSGSWEESDWYMILQNMFRIRQVLMCIKRMHSYSYVQTIADHSLRDDLKKKFPQTVLTSLLRLLISGLAED